MDKTVIYAEQSIESNVHGIEKWGTGIPRIIKSCKEFGIREPEFIEMGMDIRVNLYRDQDADKTPISADKVPINHYQQMKTR